MVDFLALVGDSSDNIPGVKGIGEKGAQKLLAEFGDLETILARAGEVTAKRAREALLARPITPGFRASWSPSNGMCRSSWTPVPWCLTSPTAKQSSGS